MDIRLYKLADGRLWSVEMYDLRIIRGDFNETGSVNVSETAIFYTIYQPHYLLLPRYEYCPPVATNPSLSPGIKSGPRPCVLAMEFSFTE